MIRGVDDGPDGLNDRAFDRALGIAPKPKRARKPKVPHEPISSADGEAKHALCFLEPRNYAPNERQYSYSGAHGWLSATLDHIATFPCTGAHASLCGRCAAVRALFDAGLVAEALFSGLRILAGMEARRGT